MRWQSYCRRNVTGTDLEHVLSLEFASAVPVPVEAFARYLGIRCETIQGDVNSLLVTRKHVGLWLADANESERRYAIAHGLGHLLLGDTCVHETSDHEHSRNHQRARDFAATLLMPPVAWFATLEKMGENPRALARYFIVPESLVEIRLGMTRD